MLVYVVLECAVPSRCYLEVAHMEVSAFTSHSNELRAINLAPGLLGILLVRRGWHWLLSAHPAAFCWQLASCRGREVSTREQLPVIALKRGEACRTGSLRRSRIAISIVGRGCRGLFLSLLLPLVVVATACTFHEVPCTIRDIIAIVAKQRAADEKQQIIAKHLAHLTNALESHATTWTRKTWLRGGSEARRAPACIADGLALVLREPKPATIVGEDARIRTAEARQDAEEHLVTEPVNTPRRRAPAEPKPEHRRVAQNGKIEAAIRSESTHGIESADARKHEKRSGALLLSEHRAAVHEMRGSIHTWRVYALFPRFCVSTRDGSRAELDALLVRRVLLVCESVVVLDDVAAAHREPVRHVREVCSGCSHRLQRGHDEWRAVGCTAQLAQSVDSKLRAGVEAVQPRRQLDVRHLHTGVDGRVAKDDVDELREFVACGVVVVADVREEESVRLWLDAFHLADDVRAAPRVFDECSGQFDSLFERDVLGSPLCVFERGAVRQQVRDCEASVRAHHDSDRGGGVSPLGSGEREMTAMGIGMAAIAIATINYLRRFDFGVRPNRKEKLGLIIRGLFRATHSTGEIGKSEISLPLP